jgi:DNA-binding transcriptional MerR regulator
VVTEESLEELRIDQLAAVAGTTTRRIRSLQTLGVLPHPVLRGRTGLYGPQHRRRLVAVLRLQEEGFSLESVGVLFRALEAGASLADVLGLAEADAGTSAGTDAAELYGFSELQARGRAMRERATGGRPLLSVLPTTVWDESEAS